jgi:CRP-like cAMP-binding protein
LERFPTLVQTLSPSASAALVAAFVSKTLPAGSLIFEEGQPVDQLILLVEGEVAVASHGHPLTEGSRGVILGEAGWIDGGPATVTVTARTDIGFLSLDRAEFQRLRGAEPAAAVQILRAINRSLATRIRVASDLYEARCTGVTPEARRPGLLTALLELFRPQVV